MPQSKKVLFIDIETFPLLSHTWSKWVDGSVVAIERDWTIACIAWKWAHKKKIHALSAYPDPHDDEPIVHKLWALLDEADVVVAHNGDKFDIKKIQARLFEYFEYPPSPFESIDTLKVMRKHFAFTSNRLDDFGAKFLGKRKVNTGGWKLWADCLANDIMAWKKMERYNRQDVALLEEAYARLQPWISNHTRIHMEGCPTCGGDHIVRRGLYHTKTMTYQRYQCQDCYGYFRGKIDEDTPRTTGYPTTRK